MKTKKRIKPIHIVVITILILSGLLAFWAWSNFSPKPLGDKLEYIGKSDHGCVIMFCDSRPGSIYYYATDMSLEEVEGYFKKIGPSRISNVMGGSDGYALQDIYYTTKDSHKEIAVTYYKDELSISRLYSFKKHAQKHAISVDAEAYTVFISSL